MTKLTAVLFIILTGILIASHSAYNTKLSQQHSISAAKIELNENYHFDLSILGNPIATKQQCVQYLRTRNPIPLLTISPEELVNIFYEEGLKEGIRPDVAFAQSLHETGFFNYGGDVLPIQNNYAGIGAIGNKVKGASFSSPTFGVRSQIQHLLAYSTTRLPINPIVDPRYKILAKIPAKYGQIKTWQGLSGTWAVPGVGYGDKILKIHREILTMPQ